MTATLLKAIDFATKKHFGQKRIGGLDYITHPIAVANILLSKGFDETTAIVGVYHDLKEDTDATDEEIIRHGGTDGETVLRTVILLTKAKGYIMKDYIYKISQDFRAKMVKLADRLHNLQCAVVASESFRKRYIKETEEYYIDLAKGTVFDDDIQMALEVLKATLKAS